MARHHVARTLSWTRGLTAQLLASMLALIGVSGASAADYPYVAYVNTTIAQVRSGPGDEYYATQTLPRGAAVDVYRRDPGGWLAIRPPEGSFSWITGDFLTPNDDGVLGKVIGNRVAVRVGSELTAKRDVIQLRLNAGEEVEILDAKRLDAGNGVRTWYKIAPPAGEFRWIPAAWVDQNPPSSQAPRARREIPLAQGTDRANSRATTDSIATQRLADETVAPAAEVDLSQAGSIADDQIRTRPLRMGQAILTHSMSEIGTETATPIEKLDAAAKREEDRWQASRTRHQQVHRPTPTVDEAPLSGDFQTGLDAIERDLSEIVVRQPDDWNFAELRHRAQRTLSLADGAPERGRALLLIAKVDRFEQMRQRQLALSNIRQAADHRDAELTAGLPANQTADLTAELAQPAVRIPAAAIATEQRYDGSGRLAAVDARQVGDPRFVLMDADGKPACYVTPAPGVNLRHYVGREIGVTGNVGFLADQKSTHVTARRVELLDKSAVYSAQLDTLRR